MADTVQNTNTLKIDLAFIDGDTRALTLKNPRENLTSSQFSELQTFMQTSNVLIGDKDGANFLRIQKATRIRQRKTNIDLSDDEE